MNYGSSCCSKCGSTRLDSGGNCFSCMENDAKGMNEMLGRLLPGVMGQFAGSTPTPIPAIQIDPSVAMLKRRQDLLDLTKAALSAYDPRAHDCARTSYMVGKFCAETAISAYQHIMEHADSVDDIEKNS